MVVVSRDVQLSFPCCTEPHLERKADQHHQTRRLHRCSFTQTDRHGCFSQSRLALVWFTGWPLTPAGLRWMDFWPCSCSNRTLALSCDSSLMHVFSLGLKYSIYFQRVFRHLSTFSTLKRTDRLFQVVRESIKTCLFFRLVECLNSPNKALWSPLTSLVWLHNIN